MQDLTALQADACKPMVRMPRRVGNFDVDRERFSVRWGNKTCQLGNTKQFLMMEALATNCARFLSFSDLAEQMGGDDQDDIRPIRSRLRSALRDAGMTDLDKCIKTECGHYGLFLHARGGANEMST